MEYIEDDPQDRVVVITDSNNSLLSLSPAKASMLETMACNVGNNLTEQQREQFHGLLVKYAGLFVNSKLDTGCTNRITNEIHTGHVIPTHQAVRRLPPPRREAVQELLMDMPKKMYFSHLVVLGPHPLC